MLTLLMIVAGAKALLCFVTSFLTGNYSQIDKLWSIVPAVYVWIVAFAGGKTPRQLLMGVLVTVWAARLTFNFWRKGGFPKTWRIWEGEEDYRWAILRKNPGLSNPFVWQIFNFFFISVYQSFLICSFTFPAVLSVDPNHELNFVDFIAAGSMLSMILLETVADQQQWVFQQKKR